MLALLNLPVCPPPARHCSRAGEAGGPARSCLAWQAGCPRAGELGGREPYSTGLVSGYWMRRGLFFFIEHLASSNQHREASSV
jgi:hypothetical protein